MYFRQNLTQNLSLNTLQLPGIFLNLDAFGSLYHSFYSFSFGLLLKKFETFVNN